MMGFLPCKSNFSGVLLFQCVAFPGKEVVRKRGNSGDKYLSVCKERILIYFFLLMYHALLCFSLDRLW